MVCPDCFTEGLEEHPGYIDEFAGKQAILRATRCPNEDCLYHYGEGVPSSMLEQQYSTTGSFSALSAGLSLKTVVGLVVGLLVVVVVVNGALNGGFTGEPTVVSLSGSVVAADGTPVSGAVVSVVGSDESVQTSQAGTFTLSNVTEGERLISVMPADETLAAQSYRFTVQSDGELTAETDYANVSAEGVRLEVDAPVPRTVEKTLANESFVVMYSNPANALLTDGVVVSIAPPDSTRITDAVRLSGTDSVERDVPGDLSGQQITAEIGVGEKRLTESGTWSSGSAPISLAGTLKPSNVVVSVSADSNSRTRTSERTVTNGTTFTETVRGSSSGPITVDFFGGTTTASTRESGVFTGENPTVEIDESASPSQTTLRLTGEVTERARTASGTVSDGTGSFTVSGTLPAQAATVAFTGGAAQTEQVGEGSVSADATGGTDSQTVQLFTAPADGTYTLSTTYTIDRNGNLVSGGYSINGEKSAVTTGTNSQTLSLNEGDAVSLYVEARQESTGSEKSYTRGTHDVYVDDTVVTPTQVAPGDPVSVTAVMENRGDGYGLDVVLFKDGVEVDRENEYLGNGETKDVTFDPIRFSESGVHTVSVNEGDPVTVQVGDGTPESGAGSVSATATYSTDSGTVTVDTNNDGTGDCTVAANGGECDLGRLSTGETQFSVSESGVTNTGFTVSYTERTGPQDVKADIDSDGVVDISNPGVLDGTIEETVELDAGLNTIDIEVGNGVPVEYVIEYAEAGQVAQPELFVDGERVVSEADNFTGERTYEIDSLDSGSHEFEVRSANATSEFNIRLSWDESGDTFYPSVFMNGNEACQPAQFGGDQTCRIDTTALSDGPATLSFNTATGITDFEYEISYTARVTAERVTVSSDRTTIGLSKNDATSEDVTGAWTIERSTQLLQSGDNFLSVEEPTVDGIRVPVEIGLSYTYETTLPESPTVTVTNSNGETNTKTVSPETLNRAGILQEETVLTLPADWFTHGENTIRVSTANGGVVVTTVEVQTSRAGSLK
jgi:hypothetical protein